MKISFLQHQSDVYLSFFPDPLDDAGSKQKMPRHFSEEQREAFLSMIKSCREQFQEENILQSGAYTAKMSPETAVECKKLLSEAKYEFKEC